MDACKGKGANQTAALLTALVRATLFEEENFAELVAPDKGFHRSVADEKVLDLAILVNLLRGTNHSRRQHLKMHGIRHAVTLEPLRFAAMEHGKNDAARPQAVCQARNDALGAGLWCHIQRLARRPSVLQTGLFLREKLGPRAKKVIRRHAKATLDEKAERCLPCGAQIEKGSAPQTLEVPEKLFQSIRNPRRFLRARFRPASRICGSVGHAGRIDPAAHGQTARLVAHPDKPQFLEEAHDLVRGWTSGHRERFHLLLLLRLRRWLECLRMLLAALCHFGSAAEHGAILDSQTLGGNITDDVTCAPQLHAIARRHLPIHAAPHNNVPGGDIGLHLAIRPDRQAAAPKFELAFDQAVDEQVLVARNLADDFDSLANARCCARRDRRGRRSLTRPAGRTCRLPRACGNLGNRLCFLIFLPPHETPHRRVVYAKVAMQAGSAERCDFERLNIVHPSGGCKGEWYVPNLGCFLDSYTISSGNGAPKPTRDCGAMPPPE